MTPDRRASLAKLADGALINLRAGCDPSPEGLAALDAVLLHWATGATMLDAVEAGYSVGPSYQVGSWYFAPPGTVPQGHYPSQADAWRAAVAHLTRAA